MKDSITIPGHFTYSFHINYMNFSQEDMKLKFLETMNKFQFSKWLAVEERGKKNKLLHLQAILWHKEELIYKKSSSIKSFRFNKQRLAKSSNKDVTQISFAKGKSTSLGPYCMKDISGSFHITNLTKEELATIPKWKEHKKEKGTFDKQIIKFCQDIRYDAPPWFRNKIIAFYIRDNRLPSSHTLRKLSLLYNHHYTPQDYQDEIGSLRNTRFSPEYYKPDYQNQEVYDQAEQNKIDLEGKFNFAKQYEKYHQYMYARSKDPNTPKPKDLPDNPPRIAEILENELISLDSSPTTHSRASAI